MIKIYSVGRDDIWEIGKLKIILPKYKFKELRKIIIKEMGIKKEIYSRKKKNKLNIL